MESFFKTFQTKPDVWKSMNEKQRQAVYSTYFDKYVRPQNPQLQDITPEVYKTVQEEFVNTAEQTFQGTSREMGRFHVMGDEPPEDDSVWKQIQRGFHTGLRIIEALPYGVAARFGSDEHRDWMIDRYFETLEKAPLFHEWPGLQNLDTPEKRAEAISYMAEHTPTQAGIFATIMGGNVAGAWAAAKAGAAMGAPLGPKGMALGGAIGGALVGSAHYLASGYPRRRRMGATHEEATGIPDLMDVASGVASIAGPWMLMRALTKKAGTEFVVNRVQNILKKAPVVASSEAVGEVIAEAFQIVGDEVATGVSLTWKEIQHRLESVAVVAAAFSGGISVSTMSVMRMSDHTDVIQSVVHDLTENQAMVNNPALTRAAINILERVEQPTREQQEVLKVLKDDLANIDEKAVTREMNVMSEAARRSSGLTEEVALGRAKELIQLEQERSLTSDESLELIAIFANQPNFRTNVSRGLITINELMGLEDAVTPEVLATRKEVQQQKDLSEATWKEIQDEAKRLEIPTHIGKRPKKKVEILPEIEAVYEQQRREAATRRVKDETVPKTVADELQLVAQMEALQKLVYKAETATIEEVEEIRQNRISELQARDDLTQGEINELTFLKKNKNLREIAPYYGLRLEAIDKPPEEMTQPQLIQAARELNIVTEGRTREDIEQLLIERLDYTPQYAMELFGTEEFMYHEIEKAIQDPKFSFPKVSKRQDLVTFIQNLAKKGKLKQSEIDDLKVIDWLETEFSPTETVSKTQLADYINANRVSLKEVQYGGMVEKIRYGADRVFDSIEQVLDHYANIQRANMKDFADVKAIKQERIRREFTDRVIDEEPMNLLKPSAHDYQMGFNYLGFKAYITNNHFLTFRASENMGKELQQVEKDILNETRERLKKQGFSVYAVEHSLEKKYVIAKDESSAIEYYITRFFDMWPLELLEFAIESAEGENSLQREVNKRYLEWARETEASDPGQFYLSPRSITPITDQDTVHHRRYVHPGPFKNYRELVYSMSLSDIQRDGTDPTFRNLNHFPDDNMVISMMVLDRKGQQGEDILFIEEFQSDWHQRGQKYGYGPRDQQIRLEKLEYDMTNLREEISRKLDDIIVDKENLIIPKADRADTTTEWIDALTEQSILKSDKPEIVDSYQFIKPVLERAQRLWAYESPITALKVALHYRHEHNWEQQEGFFRLANEGIHLFDYGDYYLYLENIYSSLPRPENNYTIPRDQVISDVMNTLTADYVSDYNVRLHQQWLKRDIGEENIKKDLTADLAKDIFNLNKMKEKRASYNSQIPLPATQPLMKATESWAMLPIKRAIFEAVEQGYKKIAWPSGRKKSMQWQNPRLEKFYDRDLPKMVNKYLKRYGDVKAKFEPEAFPTMREGRFVEAWTIDISEGMRGKHPMYKIVKKPKRPVIKSELQKRVEQSLEKFPTIKKSTKVIQRESELPKAIQRDLKLKKKEGQIGAVTYGPTIYVIADNISTEHMADYVFLDTLIRHEGRHSLYNRILGGPAQRKVFFNKAAMSLKTEVSEFLQRHDMENTTENRRWAAEEIVTDMAMAGQPLRAVDQLFAKLMEWARKIVGKDFNMTKSEMRMLLAHTDLALAGKYPDMSSVYTGPVSHIPQYSFAGFSASLQGTQWDKGIPNLGAAVDAVIDGKLSRREIFDKYGWFEIADNQWYYYIDSDDIVFREPDKIFDYADFFEEVGMSTPRVSTVTFKLNHLIKDENVKLFEHYPKLKDSIVELQLYRDPKDWKKRDFGGWYSTRYDGTPVIRINWMSREGWNKFHSAWKADVKAQVQQEDKTYFRRILIHEIQHAIQAQEGIEYAKGCNPKSTIVLGRVRDMMDPEINNLIEVHRYFKYIENRFNDNNENLILFGNKPFKDIMSFARFMDKEQGTEYVKTVKEYNRKHERIVKSVKLKDLLAKQLYMTEIGEVMARYSAWLDQNPSWKKLYPLDGIQVMLGGEGLMNPGQDLSDVLWSLQGDPISIKESPHYNLTQSTRNAETKNKNVFRLPVMPFPAEETIGDGEGIYIKGEFKFGLKTVFQSVSDRFRDLGEAWSDEFADRIDNYYNELERRLGMVNAPFHDIMKKIDKPLIFGGSGKGRYLPNFGKYFQHLDNGRVDEAQAIYDQSPKETQQLIDAFKELADKIGDENLQVRSPDGRPLMVYDGEMYVWDGGKWIPRSKARHIIEKLKEETRYKGGWRPIRKIIKGIYFPRVIREEVKALRINPGLDPQLYKQVIDALEATGRFSTREAARKWFQKGSFVEVNKNDYLANIEKARREPLPEIFYDYSWDTAADYLYSWAKRVAQVETFGQDIAGTGEYLDTVINKLPPGTHSNYAIMVRDRIYDAQTRDKTTEVIGTLNMFATATQLANPATALRNLIGGTALNFVAMGPKNVSKAFKSLMEDWTAINKEGVELGILGKDVMNLLNDNDMRNATTRHGRINEEVAKFAKWSMSRSMYKYTENIIRATAMVAAKHYLTESLNHINQHGTENRKAIKFINWCKTHNLNAEKLIMEDGQGAETAKMLRKAVNIPQGSYRIDMTPMFVDTKWGRFLFKYQKFSTQVSRLFYMNYMKPLMRSINDPAYKGERAANFAKIFAFLGAGIIGGTLDATLRFRLFGYPDRGPDPEDLLEQIAQDDWESLKLAWFLDRAHNSLINSGLYGIFSTPVQAFTDITHQRRMANPFDPPGIAVVSAFQDILQKLAQQKNFTKRDIMDTIDQNWAMIRAYRRAGMSTLEAIGLEWKEVDYHAARKDFFYVRNLTRRWMTDQGYDTRTPQLGQIWRTERSPLNQQIYEAIMTGRPEQARILYQRAMRRAQTREERDTIRRSVTMSLRNRQPVAFVGRANNERQQEFFRWLQTTNQVSEANKIRIQRIHQDYWNSVRLAGIN